MFLNVNSVNLDCLVLVLPSSCDELLDVAVALSRPLLEHIHCLVVTLGANGLLVCGEHSGGSVNLQPRKQKMVRAGMHFNYDADYDSRIFTGGCIISLSEQMYFVCLQARQLCALHYPALTVSAEETANVSGAGDRCLK